MILTVFEVFVGASAIFLICLCCYRRNHNRDTYTETSYRQESDPEKNIKETQIKNQQNRLLVIDRQDGLVIVSNG